MVASGEEIWSNSNWAVHQEQVSYDDRATHQFLPPANSGHSALANIMPRRLFLGMSALNIISHDCAFLVLLWTVVYNLYFHPLSKFPGPRYAAATRLVKHYISMRGDFHTFLKAQHDKYGPVVRYAPDLLSYTDPEAMKDIYGHRTASHKLNPKDHDFFAKEVNGVAAMISIKDIEEHGRVRRIFTNAFSDKALGEQETLIRGYVDKLIGRLRESVATKPTEPVDMVKMYNCTTFDIMGDLSFGSSLGLLETGEYSPWVESVFGSFKAFQLLLMFREYPILKPIASLFIPRSLIEKQLAHFKYSADRVDRRLEQETDRPDIWALVLNSMEKGNAISRPQMHSNAVLFMTAGTETTATALSGMTHYLLKCPDKLAKLTGEIRGAFRSEDELTMANLRRLPYLQAVIEEGLRIYPPTPAGSPRLVPEGGNLVCGEHLPAGTGIFLSHYAAFRDSENFHLPDSFVPERWLPAATEQDPAYRAFANDKKELMQPFIVGPYACLGKK
ncbi:Sir2 histone deacetylase Hst2 [Diplodia seriata]|uniref:Sir2 histone deacetylase Hst2 n=1 Tax=Diplodia seriata TaxID=420778 RepID=A0ABR3BYS9_9PEZI